MTSAVPKLMQLIFRGGQRRRREMFQPAQAPRGACHAAEDMQGFRGGRTETYSRAAG